MTGHEMLEATDSYRQQHARGLMTFEEADEAIRGTIQRYREEGRQERQRINERLEALAF